MNKIFKLILLFFIGLLSFHCGNKPAPKPECYSRRVEMLVDNIFNKLNIGVIRFLKPLTPEPIDGNHEDTENVPDDSIAVTYYLHLTNIKFPDKDYYMYYHNDNNNVDSIKLNKTTDTSNKSDYNCTIWMKLLEVNSDTTKIKIVAGYGICNHAGIEITNTDTFDVQSCKWIILDSTITQY